MQSRVQPTVGSSFWGWKTTGRCSAYDQENNQRHSKSLKQKEHCRDGLVELEPFLSEVGASFQLAGSFVWSLTVKGFYIICSAW